MSIHPFEEIPRQPESEPWSPPLVQGQDPREFDEMLHAKLVENPYGPIDPQTEDDKLWDDLEQADFNDQVKKLVLPTIGPGNLSRTKK